MNYMNHIKHITLPDGWSIESEDASTVVIKATKLLLVTVDLNMRVYRADFATTGRPLIPKSYGGRGWRDELIADAITWLKGIAK